MWKPTQQGQSPSPTSTPEQQPAARPVPVQQPTIETPRAATSSVGEQASISKGLSIKGEIGQQLGYINAFGVGLTNFALLIVVGIAFSHKAATMRFIERLSRGRFRAPRTDEFR